MDNITQIIATIAGVLTSGAIWKYLENRMKNKAQERKERMANDDGVLYIWDITRVGVSTDMDPISLGSKDLPQEMIFKHMGHRAGVTDFDCNIISPWTFASMSDDGDLGGGTLQLWRVNECGSFNSTLAPYNICGWPSHVHPFKL